MHAVAGSYMLLREKIRLNCASGSCQLFCSGGKVGGGDVFLRLASLLFLHSFSVIVLTSSDNHSLRFLSS
jgi:hypothetical protein